jgi:hypothetical protein
MRISIAAMLVGAVLAVASARGQDAAPAERHYTMTAVQPAQLKGCTVVYETVHTTAENRAEMVRAAIAEVSGKLAAAKVTPAGGPICVFKTGGGSPVMDIDVCWPVKDGTAAPEGCQARVLESAPSVTGIYQGATTSLRQGYGDFFQQVVQTGKLPTGEVRQRSLFYEGDESVNNVVLIEAVVAE